jgi:hypothetical protein
MVSFSTTNLIELLIQIGVSLLIGVTLVIPAFFIWNYFHQRKIRKKASQLDLKGGQYGIKSIKKEQTSEYPSADTNLLRRYSERRFFAGNSPRNEGVTPRDLSIERGVGTIEIKRELADSSDNRITESKSKYNWD